LHRSAVDEGDPLLIEVFRCRGQLAGIGIACLAMIGHLVGSWADARERRPALA
jgi:hypothetical protein